MTRLLRKAVVLLAPTALGCAQLPVERPAPAPFVPPAAAPVNPVDPPKVESARGVAPQEKPAAAPLPVPQPAEAPPAHDGAGLTLEELEALADRVNPSLRRDRAQIEVSRGQAVQAGLMPNPRFDTNNPWVLNGRQTVMNAGFQQEIPVMGKKNLDKSAANEGTRQAEITFNQNRAALHAAVRQQFYAVLVDQERVKVLAQIRDLAKKTLEAAVAKRAAGEATEYDVLSLRAAYQRSEGALASAMAIHTGDRKQLEAIVGEPGSVRGPLRGEVTGAYPEFDEAAVVRFVTLNHTQIALAESILRQNRVLLRRAEVDPYPNPYMGPAYQFGVVPGSDQFWFNFSFNIPVWDRNQGNIRAAKANLLAAHEAIDVSRLSLVNQAQNLLSQYLAARAVVEKFEGGALADANKAADMVRVGYANRVIDRGTLYQIQQAAVQANNDYLDALQTLWSNAAQLSGMLQQERFPPAAPAGRSNPPAP